MSWCRGASEAWLGVLADSCSSLRQLTIFGCSQVPFTLDIMHGFAEVMHRDDCAILQWCLACAVTTCHACDTWLHDIWTSARLPAIVFKVVKGGAFWHCRDPKHYCFLHACGLSAR